MTPKNWNDLDYISVSIVAILSFLGAIFNTKRYCITNKETCNNYSKAKKITIVMSHIIFDALSVGAISLVVYLGLIGYGMNEFLAVAISGFLAKEGNTAIYQFKLFAAEKLGSNTLMEELKKEKEQK